MKATDTFRKPPLRHNCAQAVAYRWRELYGNSDVMDEYQNYTAGLAPGGLCGALYAAIQACPDAKDEITREFAEKAGETRCRLIKTLSHTPCETCVQLADSLVEKHCGRKPSDG